MTLQCNEKIAEGKFEEKLRGSFLAAFFKSAAMTIKKSV